MIEALERTEDGSRLGGGKIVSLRVHANRSRGISSLFFLALLLTVAAPGWVSADEPDAISQAVAEKLAGSIRFETVSPENEVDFRAAPFLAHEKYLREQYPLTHASLSLEYVNDYTLVYEWRGRNRDLQPALFMSHTDVVPVEPVAAEEWTHPPYGGVIEEGFVWGRGALDDKIGVILWLEAVEALLEEGVVPERTIYMAFGHDEEISGPNGARVVAEMFRERGIQLAFLFDEGGMVLEGYPLIPGKTVANVVIAEKSYYTVELITRGVSGHSSIPPRSTAIGKLARAIYRVEENPMPARISEPLREMLLAARPYMPFTQRMAIGNMWLFGGSVKRSFLSEDFTAPFVRTSFAATIIEGGVKENVIPERARAVVNVRILPGDTPEQVLAHLAEVIDDPEVEINGTAWGEAPAAASAKGEAFALAEAAVAEVLPDVVVLPGLVPGATDSRHFAGIANEIIRFVPMQLTMDQVGGAHGRDERIAVDTLGASRQIAIGMVRRAAAGSE